MNANKRVLAATAAALALAMPAAAAPKAEGKPSGEQDDIGRTLVFDPKGLKGELDGPPGTVFLCPVRPDFESLIRLRSNFVPELVRSTEGL